MAINTLLSLGPETKGSGDKIPSQNVSLKFWKKEKIGEKRMINPVLWLFTVNLKPKDNFSKFRTERLLIQVSTSVGDVPTVWSSHVHTRTRVAIVSSNKWLARTSVSPNTQH